MGWAVVLVVWWYKNFCVGIVVIEDKVHRDRVWELLWVERERRVYGAKNWEIL